eukprot:GILK01000709.1.p1 GENE.GILK01000709.1~~GILK01000709.1.p1  ORF type:complete len:251 (-),score=46.88 GILK01000709.1:260-1012(-)
MGNDLSCCQGRSSSPTLKGNMTPKTTWDHRLSPGRGDLDEPQGEYFLDDERQHKAAVAIQSRFKGHLTRKQMSSYQNQANNNYPPAYQQYNPLSISQDKAGYFDIWTGSWGKFKRRFFVVKDSSLLWYPDRITFDRKPDKHLGKISLRQAIRIDVSAKGKSNKDGKQFEIEVPPEKAPKKNQKVKNRILKFRCRTTQETPEWVDILRDVSYKAMMASQSRGYLLPEEEEEEPLEAPDDEFGYGGEEGNFV